MVSQENWEREAYKVRKLIKFNANAKAVLLAVGVAITVAVVVLYHFFLTPLNFSSLATVKTIIVAILAGFGTSAAATGMITSLYAGSVNTDILTKPPSQSNYIEAKQLVLKLEEAKGEMKHYFQIAAVLLFLNAIKDIVGLFIV